MEDFRQEALRELARRELESRSLPKQGLLQRAANDVEQHIINPVEQFGRTARNMGAGFAQGIANTPANIYNLGAMGANALGAHLPQSPTFKFAPEGNASTAGEVASYFTAPELAFGAVSKALGAGGNALKALSKPQNLLTSKNSLKNELLSKHDVIENRASDAFKHVSNQVNKRGINKIPIDEHFDPGFFQNLKQYFPNTRASAELISKAESGDYNALRKMQGDLYKRAKKNLGSDFEADNLRGTEMLEKREDVNEAIANHLKNTGNHDLNRDLDAARQDWRTLQNTYYNDNISNSLVKMFNKDIRKVPDNLVNLLSEESIPMANLKEFHPGLDNKLASYKLMQGILKKVGKYGIPAAIGGGIVGYKDRH